MFCSNCGKVISDSSKFCRYCGAVIEPEETSTVNSAKTDGGYNPQPKNVKPSASVAQNSKSSTTSVSEKKNKKFTFSDVLAFIVLIIIGVVMVFLLDECTSCSWLDNTGSNTKSTSFTDREPDAEGDAEAYKAVFDDADIIHYKSFSELDNANYVMKGSDGTIYCADYGYESGVVKKWVETVYYPISGPQDEDWFAKERQMRSQLQENCAQIEALDFTTVTFRLCMYGVVQEIEYNDMDNKDNIKDLKKVTGMIALGADYISMADTEDGLIENGFIKK
ncbi:MAG: zinc ribbon domain-containing protein [Ruminococcaceae bacterium]|nr:zinc ribbon domain-containing protein [Oscillospiraceae bacterium]